MDELSPILSAPLGENSTAAPAWLARCINKKVKTYDICTILYTFVLLPNQHKTTNPQTPGVLTNQALIKKLHWWHQVGLSFGQDGTLDATSIGGSGAPKQLEMEEIDLLLQVSSSTAMVFQPLGEDRFESPGWFAIGANLRTFNLSFDTFGIAGDFTPFYERHTHLKPMFEGTHTHTFSGGA